MASNGRVSSDQRLPTACVGRVLVMDDEADVRDITRQMLERFGYLVYVAENGSKAFECYQEAKEYGYPFDAVLMDLSVQYGQDGRDAMKKLLELDPEVRVIAFSGHNTDPAITNFQDYGFKGALTKPFTIDKLISLLRNVTQG